MSKTDLRAKDIVAALRRHLQPERWAFFPEFIAREHMAREERRLDVFAVSIWSADHFCRRVYEVKVSRGDWLQEVGNAKTGRPGNAAKRRIGLLLSNEFWFAAPAGLVKPEEVPLEAGLVEVDRAGKCHTGKEAPWRECLPPTWATVGMIARRTQREEQQPMAEVAIMAMEEGVRSAIGHALRDGHTVAELLKLAAMKPSQWSEKGELIACLQDAMNTAAIAEGADWIRRNGIFSR